MTSLALILTKTIIKKRVYRKNRRKVQNYQTLIFLSRKWDL
ncbi:hypothetical protein FM106_11400 [Brachybacterium faecium]|nr:hypothetical protein FM106_11400 [Brachybacterium faecium]